MAKNAPQPFVGATIAKAAAGTVIKEALGAAMQRAASKPGGVTPANAQKLTDDLAEEMSRDPVVVNATNSEPLWQSRILNGATVAALGVVIPLIGRMFGFEIAEADVVKVGGAIVTLAGIGYVIIGRTVRGLKPMWSRLREWRS